MTIASANSIDDKPKISKRELDDCPEGERKIERLTGWNVDACIYALTSFTWPFFNHFDVWLSSLISRYCNQLQFSYKIKSGNRLSRLSWLIFKSKCIHQNVGHITIVLIWNIYDSCFFWHFQMLLENINEPPVYVCYWVVWAKTRKNR